MKTAREVAEEFLQTPFGIEPKDFGEMISYVDKMVLVLSEVIHKDRESVREEAARKICKRCASGDVPEPDAYGYWASKGKRSYYIHGLNEKCRADAIRSIEIK